MAAGPETKIKDKIVDYLKERGGVVIKFHGDRHQVGGIPDLYYAEGGVSVWFEVKQPGEPHPVTALQAKMIRDLSKQGIPAFVVHSVEEVNEICFALFAQV